MRTGAGLQPRPSLTILRRLVALPIAAEIDAGFAGYRELGDALTTAHEAGVVYFIDRALATFDADLRENYRAGMAAVQQKRQAMFPDSAGIATLTNQRQIQLIQAIESTDFFELLRTHTLYGFLGNPSYGGNRDRIGWKLIGFEDRMAYQPPFGYYDGGEQ